MPLRKIILSDGREVSRNVTDVHPDGGEFLPEKFTVPVDSGERGTRIYDMLAEVIKQLK